MDSMYLDNLDEFIKDENKIVTYRWLSLTLNVPSNIAKQMLFHYYDEQRKLDQESELHLTYLLTGLKLDEELKQEVHKVCIVREENFEKQKKTFKEVYSSHIYSIQRKRLKDLHILYGVDIDKIRENATTSPKYSSISCPSAGARATVSEVTPQIADTKEIPKLTIRDESSENKENKPGVGNQKIKVATKAGPKGAIASMFANIASKKDAKSSAEDKKPDLKSKSTCFPDSKKGSLSSFLTKGPPQKDAKVLSPIKVEPASPTKKSSCNSPSKIKEVANVLSSFLAKGSPLKRQSSPLKREVVEVESSPEKTEKTVSPLKVKSEPAARKKYQTSKGKSSAKGGKRKSSKTSPNNDTSKRRRILAIESSSESSEEEEELVLDESPLPDDRKLNLESDDEEEPIPPTPSSGSSRSNIPTGKRRKKMDNTWESDGFLVTKKDVLITDSEGEDEEPLPSRSPVKNLTKSPQKSKIPSPKKEKTPVKKKQSTITSFFIKKN